LHVCTQRFHIRPHVPFDAEVIYGSFIIEALGESSASVFSLVPVVAKGVVKRIKGGLYVAYACMHSWDDTVIDGHLCPQVVWVQMNEQRISVIRTHNSWEYIEGCPVTGGLRDAYVRKDPGLELEKGKKALRRGN
jgi:hypothetical protein